MTPHDATAPRSEPAPPPVEPSHAVQPPPPLVAPHFEASDRDDPTGVDYLSRPSPDVAAAIRAWHELGRVARDPARDPAMPKLLGTLRIGEAVLQSGCFEAKEEFNRSKVYLDRINALPMDTLENIRAADAAEDRLAAATARWKDVYESWAQVHWALHHDPAAQVPVADGQHSKEA